MRFGAMNSPVFPVLDEIRIIGEMGFDYLELTLDAPEAHFSIINPMKHAIRKTLEEYSLDIVCHMPTFVNTADLTERIRKAAVDEICDSMETASELGAGKVVLHPGIATGMGIYVPDNVRSFAYDSLEILYEKAKKTGIRICIENMIPRCGLFFEPGEFTEVFERFPEMRMTFDIGHAMIESGRGKRAVDFIRNFGNRIGHIHLSDNKTQRDDHLPIGKGRIPFKKVFRELKKTGYADTVTFEIFEGDKKNLLASRVRFSEIFNEI